MNLQHTVKEDISPNVGLQVYHRRLKIPLATYLQTVNNYPDPWDERAYQFFVHKYLEETNDQGIVGMVRQEKDEEFVYLDAAVRYPTLN